MKKTASHSASVGTVGASQCKPSCTAIVSHATSAPSSDQRSRNSGAIALPTLVFWCDGDRVLDVSAVDTLVRGLPLAELQTLRGCGHLPMMERPAATAAALRSFVDAHRSGAALRPVEGLSVEVVGADAAIWSPAPAVISRPSASRIQSAARCRSAESRLVECMIRSAVPRIPWALALNNPARGMRGGQRLASPTRSAPPSERQ